MLRIGKASEKEVRRYSFVGSVIQYLRGTGFRIKGTLHLCLRAACRPPEKTYI